MVSAIFTAPIRLLTSAATLSSGNLTEHQVVTHQISHDECRTAFAGLKIGLRKRENDHLADHRLADAASSSGVFQSLASADSLKSKPLKASSSFLRRKKRAKS
jgi:hypothetical protein